MIDNRSHEHPEANAATNPDGGVRLRSTSIIMMLGALVAVGPLTIDMYLPALPAIVGDLDTTEPLVQLTLTGTLLGLGLGQLFVGPVSDSAGRRRPLLAGLALHVVASLLAAVAWDISVLGGLRVLQGLGAAAATVVAVAVVRDLFEGRAAATAISRLMLVMGAAPILAPMLGSAVLLAGSWRWVFGALAVLGIALMVGAAAALPETHPPQRRPPAGLAQVWHGYQSILRDGQFVLLALAGGLTFGAMFSYVAGSSFVLQQQFGLDEQQFGLLFGVSAVAMIGGAQLNPLLLRRFSPPVVARVASAWTAATGLVLATLQVAEIGSLLGFVVPVLGMLAAGAVVVPNTEALALSRHGDNAGTAAAVIGAIRFSFGALVAVVVGALGNDGLATATAMTGSAVAGGIALALFAGREQASPKDIVGGRQ